jgi:hypothetical protein
MSDMTLFVAPSFASYALPNHKKSDTVYDENSAAAHVVFYSPQERIGNSIGWYIRLLGVVGSKTVEAFKRSEDRRINRLYGGRMDGPRIMWNLALNTWQGRIVLSIVAVAVAFIALSATNQEEIHASTYKPVPTTAFTEYYYWEGDVWTMYLTPSPLAVAQQETGVSAQAPASSHYSLDNDATQQVAPEFTPTR